MLVDHLRHGVAEQHNVLVKRFDLPLEFDAVHQINGHRHMFTPELVQKRVLQKLAFVIAHDMFRVQRVEEGRTYHSQQWINGPSGLILILVGIAGCLEFDAHGRPHEVKRFAKASFQIPLVGVGHMFQ